MSDLIRDPVTDYIRKWILEQRRADRKWREISKDVGVSRAALDDISKGVKRAWMEVVTKFAEFKFGGSMDALNRAAIGQSEAAAAIGEEDWMRTLTEEERLTVDYAMRCEKISADAIRRAMSTFYCGAGSLQGADLLETFRIAERQLKIGIVGVPITAQNSQEKLVPFDMLKSRRDRKRGD